MQQPHHLLHWADLGLALRKTTAAAPSQYFVNLADLAPLFADLRLLRKSSILCISDVLARNADPKRRRELRDMGLEFVGSSSALPP